MVPWEFCNRFLKSQLVWFINQGRNTNLWNNQLFHWVATFPIYTCSKIPKHPYYVLSQDNKTFEWKYCLFLELLNYHTTNKVINATSGI